VVDLVALQDRGAGRLRVRITFSHFLTSPQEIALEEQKHALKMVEVDKTLEMILYYTTKNLISLTAAACTTILILQQRLRVKNVAMRPGIILQKIHL
jgi:hypothetical protein